MALSDNPDRYYTNPGDIYGVFRALQADRSTINIQFSDNGPLYNSLVLKADLRQRTILLDEITPGGGHDRAINGEPFSLRASVHGIRVYAPGLRIIRQSSDDDGIYYQVAFPDKLLYLQRRDAFRVPVPARLQMAAQCHFEARDPITASVENLSATGIRLLLPGELEPSLQAMAAFRLELTLPAPEQGTMQLKTTLMHQHYDRGRNVTVCGCRFEDLKRPDQVTLNRVVTQMQREALA